MLCFLSFQFFSTFLPADFGDGGPRGQQDKASGTMEEPRRAFVSSSSHFGLFVLIVIIFVLGVFIYSLCICVYMPFFTFIPHFSSLLGYRGQVRVCHRSGHSALDKLLIYKLYVIKTSIICQKGSDEHTGGQQTDRRCIFYISTAHDTRQPWSICKVSYITNKGTVYNLNARCFFNTTMNDIPRDLNRSTTRGGSRPTVHPFIYFGGCSLLRYTFYWIFHWMLRYKSDTRRHAYVISLR